jgi:hypothetical protein
MTHPKKTYAILWTVRLLARMARRTQMIAQATAQLAANPAYVGFQYHLGLEGVKFSFDACIGMPPVTCMAPSLAPIKVISL